MFKLTTIPEAERRYKYVRDFIGGCIYYDDTRAADYLDGTAMPVPQCQYRSIPFMRALSSKLTFANTKVII